MDVQVLYDVVTFENGQVMLDGCECIDVLEDVRKELQEDVKVVDGYVRFFQVDSWDGVEEDKEYI